MPLMEQTGNVLPGRSPSLADMIAPGAIKCARAKYSFADDGGAAGDIVLLSEKLPVGAVVLFGYLQVDTAPTSGGAATVAIKLQAAGDIVAAAAISGAPWSTTGKKSIIPVATGATAVTVATSAKQITATIATADLTAGIFEVVLFYIETA